MSHEIQMLEARLVQNPAGFGGRGLGEPTPGQERAIAVVAYAIPIAVGVGTYVKTKSVPWAVGAALGTCVLEVVGIAIALGSG